MRRLGCFGWFGAPRRASRLPAQAVVGERDPLACAILLLHVHRPRFRRRIPLKLRTCSSYRIRITRAQNEVTVLTAPGIIPPLAHLIKMFVQRQINDRNALHEAVRKKANGNRSLFDVMVIERLTRKLPSNGFIQCHREINNAFHQP